MCVGWTHDALVTRCTYLCMHLCENKSRLHSPTILIDILQCTKEKQGRKKKETRAVKAHNCFQSAVYTILRHITSHSKAEP